MTEKQRPSTSELGKIETTVCGCARCGGDHSKLVFEPLKNALGKYTHFAMCPALREPIMCIVSAIAENASVVDAARAMDTKS